MRAPLRLLATTLVALAMASCQNDPISQSSTEVRLAPRLVATAPVPAAHRIRVALVVDGNLLDTLDLPYTSGQELTLGSVPSGSSFEVALVGYDTGWAGPAARWGSLARGTASSPGVHTVVLELQIPERPAPTYSGAGTSTLDTLTSPDSLWAADLVKTNHPAQVGTGSRYPVLPGAPAPNSGAIVFARADSSTFIPTALATAWSTFRLVWSDTVVRVFSAPTDKAVLGSFLDTRDGRSYATTTWLGTTWMAENLAWAGFDGTLGLCYDNDTAACTRSGRLYTFGQAMGTSSSSTSSPSTAQGICPTGWHLPSPAEWDNLGVRLGGKGDAADSLRDRAAWPGRPKARDAIGFSALPSGQGYAYDTTFAGRTEYAWWWTSEQLTSSDAVRYGMTESDADLFVSSGTIRGLYNQMFAVRCVKNQP